jgi:hypothetical protein
VKYHSVLFERSERMWLWTCKRIKNHLISIIVWKGKQMTGVILFVFDFSETIKINNYEYQGNGL